MDRKECFMVITRGTWGCGKNPVEAAQNCIKSGAKKTDECSLRYILGTNKAQFDGMYLSYDEDPIVSITVGIGFKIGQLLKTHQ